MSKKKLRFRDKNRKMFVYGNLIIWTIAGVMALYLTNFIK